jgi:nicotinamide-nucleotide amidase
MSSLISELALLAGKALKEEGANLATAESCTGGGIAEAITRIAGSSAWFERGWVTYSNRAKEQELGVSSQLITQHGAVSEAVVLAMAAGARLRAETKWAIAVSGIAGPDGGSAEKPVGTVWLAWSGPGRAYAMKRVFSGGREEIRRSAVEAALQGLVDKLKLARQEEGM